MQQEMCPILYFIRNRAKIISRVIYCIFLTFHDLSAPTTRRGCYCLIIIKVVLLFRIHCAL
jgi:hypothetical protein